MKSPPTCVCVQYMCNYKLSRQTWIEKNIPSLTLTLNWPPNPLPHTHTVTDIEGQTHIHANITHHCHCLSYKNWLSIHIPDPFEPNPKSRSRILLQWIIRHDHWADDYCLQVWTGLVKFYFAQVGRSRQIFFHEGCMCSLQSHTTYGPSTLAHLPQICLGAHCHMSNVTSLFVTDQCDSSQLLQWTLHAEMSLHNWQNVKIQLPSKEPK